MMFFLCSSNSLQAALTSTVYFMVVLTTCSTKECGLRLTEKTKSRSVVFRNVDMMLCQTKCVGDSFIFASCRRSNGESTKTEIETNTSTHHHRVLTAPCGSKVCHETSQCVDAGCKKVCMEAPPMCDLHTASKTGNLSRVKLLLSQGQANVNCQEWIGRTPVMWAAHGGHREVVELLMSKGAKVSLVDRFGINIFHSACLGGDVEVVTYVLSHSNLNVNGRVQCGRTAVMLAAENGHKDVVELLVDKGADVSLVDKTGDTILHCACRGGDVEVVKYILSKKMVDINSRGHGKKTPATVAVESGHKEVVGLLQKYEAYLMDKNPDDSLHRACYAGQFDVVKYILSLNMVNINSRGKAKRTPVIEAAEQGHVEVVKLLVKNGANLLLSDTNGDNSLHRACFAGQLDVVKYILSLSSVDINSRGRKKWTPVIEAAEQGHIEVVKLLVKQGANLLLRDENGDNILHRASYPGHFDVVKYILSLNTVDINSKGLKKRTPAMATACFGKEEVLKLLVKHGADLSLSGIEGNILHIACRAYFSLVKYILSLNTVDVNSRGWKRGTPLMSASRQRNKQLVVLLAQSGADPLLRDQASENTLHHTCVTGFLDVVKYILSLTSWDVNCRGWKGRTPMMIAARFGHTDVVKLLVKNGANPSLRNSAGKSALDVARDRKHPEVVQYLMSL